MKLSIDATLIDFACCFGHDIRLWISDGVPIQQLRGYDIDSRFIEQGYQLFRDEKLMKDNHFFQSALIFLMINFWKKFNQLIM